MNVYLTISVHNYFILAMVYENEALDASLCGASATEYLPFEMCDVDTLYQLKVCKANEKVLLSKSVSSCWKEHAFHSMEWLFQASNTTRMVAQRFLRTKRHGRRRYMGGRE
jgi:hypothetical protein